MVCFQFSMLTLAQTNSKLLISPLTQNFYIYTTYGDPGNGTLFPSNGMYVVTEEGVVLLDTPWDSTQFQPLLDSIQARHHKEVVMCIATHFHEDRTAGLEYYRQKGIRSYSTGKTDSLSKERNEHRAEFVIYDDTTFDFGSTSFETYYPGKGHSPDNIVIWFGKELILYGGCFVKSVEANGLGNLAEASIDDWIVSVEKVQARFRSPEFIIPGHQDWKSKKALEHTLKLLKIKKQTGEE